MIIDQLPLLGGNVDSNDEIPIERGTTSYKTTQAALVKSAADAAAAAQTSADNAQTAADDVASSLMTYVRPNLLDNWYFVGGGSQLGYGVFPINQRGQATYSDNVFLCDRWRLDSANMTATINSNFVSISNNYASLRTAIQTAHFDYSVVKGKTLTASILLSDGSLYFGSYLIPTGAPTSGTGWYTFLRNSTLVLELDVVQAKRCDFVIGIPSGATLNIIAVKLEIGSTQTLAHQESGAWVLNEVPNYVEELAKCKLYFERISAQYAHIGSGFCISTTAAYVWGACSPKRSMVFTAGVSFSGTMYIWTQGKVGNNATQCTTILDGFCSPNGEYYFAFAGSGFTTGEPCAAQIRDTSTYIDISAE